MHAYIQLEIFTQVQMHIIFNYTSLWGFSGEGNGSPLRCSCLENPRDGGAWLASIYGVAQGQTQLK